MRGRPLARGGAWEGQGQLARALTCVAFPHQAFLCSLLSVDPPELVTLTGLAGVVGSPWLYGASLLGPPTGASAASHGASPQGRPGSRAAERGSGLSPSDASLWVKLTLHPLPSLLILRAELRVVGAWSQGP